MGKYDVKITTGKKEIKLIDRTYRTSYEDFLNKYNKVKDKELKPIFEYSVDDFSRIYEYNEKIKEYFEPKEDVLPFTLYEYVFENNHLVQAFTITKDIKIRITKPSYYVVNIQEYNEKEFDSLSKNEEKLRVISLENLKEDLSLSKSEIAVSSIITSALVIAFALTIPTLINCFKLDFGNLSMELEEAKRTRACGLGVVLFAPLGFIKSFVLLDNTLSKYSDRKKEYARLKSLKLTKE